MHKPESDLENEMLKILWDFEIQTDNKKKEDFCHLCGQRNENQTKRKER